MHLLVSELYIYQKERCNNKKNLAITYAFYSTFFNFCCIFKYPLCHWRVLQACGETVRELSLASALYFSLQSAAAN